MTKLADLQNGCKKHRSAHPAKDHDFEYFGWYQYQFWRYVFVQQYVGKLATTAIEFPPMQKGAGFNLDAVKEKIAEATKARQ